MKADLLLEIGCEEIPARMLRGASDDLAVCVTDVLAGSGLEHGDARSLCTPRRLAVLVRDVALRQADRDEDVSGPPVRAAFDTAGKPTKAALGFAQKMGVDVASLARIATPKGEYLGVRRHLPGRSARELLAETLPRAIAGMSFPKTMRWGSGAYRFVRPVHWIVALLGPNIVPLEIFAVRAGRVSAGHRVMGQREVTIPSPGQYESLLLAQGVAVDRDQRRRTLSRRLVELAGEDGVRPVEDPDLLEEAADLVEHPAAVLGSFPLEFLELPREILVTTLRHHQKAFATETDEGLSHRFLVVADLDQDADGFIRKGNEWVVVGRLEDARFFFQEDRKVPFDGRREKLDQVTFHAKAGSYLEKSRRVESIATNLGEIVNRAWADRAGDPGLSPKSRPRGGGGMRPHAAQGSKDGGSAGSLVPASIDLDALRAAARLAKCDLTSGLVGEFPELQGIAGGLYMKIEGGHDHPPGAAEAVYDQYRPAGAKDALPRTGEGALLALADRLDTLAALARCVGLPSGSKDPFGLRRAASGAIRIVVETPLPLSLDSLVRAAQAAASGIATQPDSSASDGDTQAFLVERLQFWLREKDVRYDTVNAVLLASGGHRAPREALPRLVEKTLALERLRDLPDFAALVEIHKRCRNLLEQAEDGDGPTAGDKAIRVDPQETEAFDDLLGQVNEARGAVTDLVKQDDFEGSLHRLVRVRPALTRFFDHVLVMHPDRRVRAARLDLVRRTAEMIEEVADLKQISISREELKSLLTQLATEAERTSPSPEGRNP